MRIHFMSDLHLEFGALQKPLPRGDVLVLAGDIFTTKHFAVHRTDAAARSVQKALHVLLTEASEKFKRIFALPGNHEPYGDLVGVWAKQMQLLRRRYQNLWPLQNRHYALTPRTVLVGGTLWTAMRDRAGKDASAAVELGMNDFRIVGIAKGRRVLRFTPADAIAMHRRTLGHIDIARQRYPTRDFVVATHHQPSFQGVNPAHGGNRLDAGYATDLEEWIGQRRNIRYWIAGHTHVRTAYDVAQCRVVANCRGYIGHEPMAYSFDPDRWIEVE